MEPVIAYRHLKETRIMQSVPFVSLIYIHKCHFIRAGVMQDKNYRSAMACPWEAQLQSIMWLLLHLGSFCQGDHGRNLTLYFFIFSFTIAYNIIHLKISIGTNNLVCSTNSSSVSHTILWHLLKVEIFLRLPIKTPSGKSLCPLL